MKFNMKILKYFILFFFALSMARGQNTFTEEQALEMIEMFVINNGKKRLQRQTR